MKQLQLFTKKLFDAGKVPTSLRDGTKILSFHCLPAATKDGGHVFFGVTADRRALAWKKDGHANGGKNMKTDLIYIEVDPDDLLFFVGFGPNGKPYSTNTWEQLMEIKMPLLCAFQIILNTRTLVCTVDRAKLPKP
jgi:hypothetical protein